VPSSTLVRLNPVFIEKPWGVANLDPWFGNPRGQRIGEVHFSGVGDSPLLVKFIFTSEPLSVQVHPNDSQARAVGYARGKTELWHILKAAPSATVAAGFAAEISREDLENAAATPAIIDLLTWHSVQAGDTLLIPAGTVHAIGADIVLCEIQQNSDIVYRLYDFGRHRDLHIAEALLVSHMTPWEPYRQLQDGVLAECPYFMVSRMHAKNLVQTVQLTSGEEYWVILEGAGEIGGRPTKQGEVWHCTGTTESLQFQGELTMLRVMSKSSVD
jgi:mannose-6-phosphate isomerase